jgi:hypothetical protein
LRFGPSFEPRLAPPPVPPVPPALRGFRPSPLFLSLLRIKNP